MKHHPATKNVRSYLAKRTPNIPTSDFGVIVTHREPKPVHALNDYVLVQTLLAFFNIIKYLFCGSLLRTLKKFTHTMIDEYWGLLVPAIAITGIIGLGVMLESFTSGTNIRDAVLTINPALAVFLVFYIPTIAYLLAFSTVIILETVSLVIYSIKSLYRYICDFVGDGY